MIVLSAMLFSATECVCVLMSAVAALSATSLHTAHSPALRRDTNYLRKAAAAVQICISLLTAHDASSGLAPAFVRATIF